MPLSPIDQLSDDETFATPPANKRLRKSPETCPEEKEEVAPPAPKKLKPSQTRLEKEPEGDESVEPSSTACMKRPASAKPKSGAALKRPASAKASAKAEPKPKTAAKKSGKQAKAEYEVSEGPVRAYKSLYKESKAWGIKIKGKNQVLQVRGYAQISFLFLAFPQIYRSDTISYCLCPAGVFSLGSDR